MKTPNLDIPEQLLADFCLKWKIVEMSLFGSVLRDDFGPGSDVDVLVVYETGVVHGIDGYIEMNADLEAMFTRRVDIVNKRYLENPFLRHEILTTRRVVYAA